MKTKQTTIRFWQLWRTIKRIFVREREANDYFIANVNPDPEAFMRKLIPSGFQYNYFSYNFKGQICNVRKLIIHNDSEIWQYHLRLYDYGKVTGHFEKSYEEDALEHIKGIGLVEIPEAVRKGIIEALK